MSPSDNPDGEFAYGSGHIDPIRATNPGLVYEATKNDYIAFLCKFGYSDDEIRLITGDKSSCPRRTIKTSSPTDVNYPSMSAGITKKKGSFSVTFQRTVTNIGVANSTYVAKIEPQKGSKINVTVTPNTLSFMGLKEQKLFEVTVVGEAKDLSPTIPVSASLVWSDGIHSVRSPIVVYSGSA